MGDRIGRAFFAAPAPELAPRLLGKLICRATNEGIVRCRITETEAYYGETDTACHAHRGRTPRTAMLYRAGGVAYVYLCYGIHNLLNVVTGPEGHPEAVLIRGVEGAAGPGRLTKLLDIGRDLNGEDLVDSQRLWLENDGLTAAYRTAPRVGIDYAAPTDRERFWRFIADSMEDRHEN